MSSVTIDMRALPYGLRSIVKHLGVEKTIAILTEKQGQMFYIPKQPTADHEVVKIFGMDVVNELLAEYETKHYQMPMLHKVLMQIRNQEICKELDNKTSTIQQLVMRFKITRQQITSIYSAYQDERAHETQLNLSL
ncbi:Mor transcription activator family protein [Pseudoalteromonas translucida]|uniref:Orphan protein n=1 Tax=Pseudoalteromonas translucida (strain TAC 125) TaxID=326442 RepID=Q3IGJ2_PSET1|nr:Mor transcription activator family protein [Pseudoalteromonas translucida]CAI86591.1 putative orphan protein [Pseudoalteromonas translucida]